MEKNPEIHQSVVRKTTKFTNHQEKNSKNFQLVAEKNHEIHQLIIKREIIKFLSFIMRKK